MTSPRARRHAQATKARALPRALSWARDLTPRARGDHVRALAAHPGSSTAPHHHEIDYCRNHHQPRNQWGLEVVRPLALARSWARTGCFSSNTYYAT